MSRSWFRFGIPARSGLALMSNLSESSHDGPPVTCFKWTPYAIVIRSATLEFVVVNRFDPPLPTTIDRPGVSGLAGLIVATSNTGFASDGISRGGGGGSGISHAVA